MNQQGFGGEKVVKREWADKSGPQGVTLASARIEPQAFPAAVLISDDAAALTCRHIQNPLPPPAGAATRRRRGSWRETGGRG